MRSARVFIGSIVVVSVAVMSVVYAVVSRPRPRPDAPQGGAITGRVVDPEGKPVAGGLVYASRKFAPLGRLPTTVTDQQGAFSFSELPPEPHTVYASKEEDGYPLSDSPFYAADPTKSSVAEKNSAEVNVYEQQTASDVTIFLGPRVAKLTGRVRNLSGKLIRDAQISLCRLDMPDNCYSTGVNSEEGPFEVLAPRFLSRLKCRRRAIVSIWPPSTCRGRRLSGLTSLCGRPGKAGVPLRSTRHGGRRLPPCFFMVIHAA